jgi:glutathione S-transferase
LTRRSTLTQAFTKKPDERDPKRSRRASGGHGRVCTSRASPAISSPALSAADFAFYPLVAFVKRAEMKLPDLDADGMLTPELRAWKARMEELPFYEKTIPPHWKAS